MNRSACSERAFTSSIASMSTSHRPVVEGPRAQVDDVDARRRGAAGAVRQLKQAVSAAPDVVDRLQRRGRAAEDDRRPGVPGAHHREVARGVAEPVLLLEGEIVLLIHDEEPRPRQRAKTAERVPTSTSAAPLRARAHAESRSPSESPECSASTRQGSRAWKRASNCGVRPIRERARAPGAHLRRLPRLPAGTPPSFPLRSRLRA